MPPIVRLTNDLLRVCLPVAKKMNVRGEVRRKGEGGGCGAWGRRQLWKEGAWCTLLYERGRKRVISGGGA